LGVGNAIKVGVGIIGKTVFGEGEPHPKEVCRGEKSKNGR